MLRELRAFCLWAFLVGLFYLVGALPSLCAVWLLSLVLPDGVMFHVGFLGMFLLFVASVMLSGRVVKRLFPAIPTCKPYASTDWADSE